MSICSSAAHTGVYVPQGKVPGFLEVRSCVQQNWRLHTSSHVSPWKALTGLLHLQLQHIQCTTECFVLFCFLGYTRGIWKFPGQRSNLSCSSDLQHSCGNTRSFTHCAGLGIKVHRLRYNSRFLTCCATGELRDRMF